MKSDLELRKNLISLLKGKSAHDSFDKVVADFPMDRINDFPPNVPYTSWHLIEHLRLTQNDILDFIQSSNYKAPKWPEGFWPAKEKVATPDMWQESINRFKEDLKRWEDLVMDSSVDLFAIIPNSKKSTIFRLLLIVANHNSYHVGEFGILRQVMGTWPRSRT